MLIIQTEQLKNNKKSVPKRSQSFVCYTNNLVNNKTHLDMRDIFILLLNKKLNNHFVSSSSQTHNLFVHCFSIYKKMTKHDC